MVATEVVATFSYIYTAWLRGGCKVTSFHTRKKMASISFKILKGSRLVNLSFKILKGSRLVNLTYTRLAIKLSIVLY